MPRVLIIGYGNPLRRDDGAGPLVAGRVEAWQVAGLAVQAVHQLVPELAEALSAVPHALFVDAGHDCAEVTAREVTPAAAPASLGHTSDPGLLLVLAEALYGGRPRAWLLTVPAPDLGFGAGLSPAARDGVEHALAWVRAWLRGLGLAVE